MDQEASWPIIFSDKILSLILRGERGLISKSVNGPTQAHVQESSKSGSKVFHQVKGKVQSNSLISKWMNVLIEKERFHNQWMAYRSKFTKLRNWLHQKMPGSWTKAQSGVHWTCDIKYRSRNRDRLTECEKQLAQLAGTKTSPPTRGPAFILNLRIGLISQ